MFQRGDPNPSDAHLSHVYGLALPLLKRGVPVTPVQLENLTVPRYLDGFHLLLLTYHGMKPLSPEVHAPLADWVKRGGVLVVCDDDSDPSNGVRDWWNGDGRHYATPREHLFEQLSIKGERLDVAPASQPARIGKGALVWMRENPAQLAASTEGDRRLVQVVKEAAARSRVKWRETNWLLLRRGPYVIAAGLDESDPGEAKVVRGRFVNLFDPELRVRESVSCSPGTRYFLLDLDAARRGRPHVLASACKALPAKQDRRAVAFVVEGVANTPAVVLLHSPKAPSSVALAGQPLQSFAHSSRERLLWIRFNNESRPRELVVND
jgi:hypothetical protein